MDPDYLNLLELRRAGRKRQGSKQWDFGWFQRQLLKPRTIPNLPPTLALTREELHRIFDLNRKTGELIWKNLTVPQAGKLKGYRGRSPACWQWKNIGTDTRTGLWSRRPWSTLGRPWPNTAAIAALTITPVFFECAVRPIFPSGPTRTPLAQSRERGRVFCWLNEANRRL